MAFLASSLGGEVGLRLLLSPVGSNVIARTACVAVGVGLPVYSTFKAIERKDPEEQEQWLVYWAVYGCFSVAEIFSDKLLSWFPCYYHAKLVFLIWLQLPLSNGARHCFMSYLRPFLLKHQAKLDRIVNGSRNEICNFIVAHEQEIQFIRVAFQKMAMTAYQATHAGLGSNTPEGSSSRSITDRTQSTSSPVDSEESSNLPGPLADSLGWINVTRDENILGGQSPRNGQS